MENSEEDARASAPLRDIKREPSLGKLDLREVMRYFPSAVTIVTSALDSGELFGLTVSAFISVSLDPPLVLIAIRDESTAKDLFIKSNRYCVNILSTAQQNLAERFSLSGEAERFLNLDFRIGKGGSPIITGCIGYIDCKITKIWSAGDHTLFLGRVVDLAAEKKEPLLYLDRKYVRLGKE